MKKTLLATLLATVCSVGTVLAADMYVKAPPVEPVAVYNPWDIAFGAGLYSDYNFRGISQSNRKPSVNAYFEPRYNINNNLQLYAGLGAWSIAFSNRPSAEVDIYGGIRPTFGKLSFDLGAWYYYYPGGTCYNGNLDAFGNTFGPDCFANGSLPVNGNVIKKDLSFVEYFAKASLAVTDNFSIGGGGYYDVNWLNFGFDAVYASVNAKITVPSAWMPANTGAYISGEYGHYWLGTTDAFYGYIPLPDYSTWNVGAGLTWSVFTVDLRYYDSDLSKGECNAITSDFTATFSPANIIPVVNPGGFGSKWCGESYVISLKADLTYGSNVK
ncbi:MAG: TorF family putative porin [Xanthobacteraceae bacterium]